MIKYVKEQIEELLTKDEIAHILKGYADEIKHSIEETAIRDYDKDAKVFAEKNESDKYYILTNALIETFKENLRGISSNDVQKAVGETKWHDLKKDSSDLPEPHATVLDEDGNKITYQGGGEWTFYSDYYGMDIEAIRPVAWCEIPTFKV